MPYKRLDKDVQMMKKAGINVVWKTMEHVKNHPSLINYHCLQLSFEYTTYHEYCKKISSFEGILACKHS